MDTLGLIHVGTGLAMVVLVLLELRDPQFRADSFAAGPRRRRNWAFFFTSFIPTLLVQSAGAWFHTHLPTLMRPGTLPPVVDFVACMLVAELVSWTSHWVKHQHPFLWRFHFQHHREEHFSVWMVTHTHALEVMLSGTALVALLAGLGFSPLSVQLYFALYSVVLTYHHSARGYSLGWLDWLIISPAYHRHHHRRVGKGNYGGTLTVWDVVFGTVHWPEPETATAPVGLPPQAREPFGYRKEMLYFLTGWRRQRS
ncbi:sterol desaturase family protein [Archangium violaceum]|uniref:sterol desaturase family protein n=1 Tax=Archangium violaceum TaxID=83451 RepID=UPI002B2ED6F1|nr:sterol desaturase family protein [Archangium gephyra]